MSDRFTPVDQERIEAMLDGFNLKHFRGEDGTTHTAFPGLVVFFHLESAGFKISTRWLATAKTAEEITALRLAANELNRLMPLVRVHPVLREDHTAVAIFEAPFFTPGGLTDEQLQSMLEFYFSAIHHMADQLNQELPDLTDPLPGTTNPAPAKNPESPESPESEA